MDQSNIIDTLGTYQGYGGLGFRMVKRGRWEGVKHDLGTRLSKIVTCYTTLMQAVERRIGDIGMPDTSPTYL